MNRNLGFLLILGRISSTYEVVTYENILVFQLYVHILLLCRYMWKYTVLYGQSVSLHRHTVKIIYKWTKLDASHDYDLYFD